MRLFRSRAAVVRFDGHRGVFTMSGLEVIAFRYNVWGGHRAQEANDKVQALVDRFAERVLATARAR